MEEKTLLAEIETERKKQIEKRFAKYIDEGKAQQKEQQNQSMQQGKKPQTPGKKTAFSSTVFQSSQTAQQTTVQPETKPAPAESQSLVIEKPNYDFIESLTDAQREKIFIKSDDELQSDAKPKPNKFKKALICILFAIFGVWGITNIAMIDNINGQISQLASEYNMNLISYLNNINNLDATNSKNMENLFETIPSEQTPPTTIGEKSNWFDRFCNFISGLFGG